MDLCPLSMLDKVVESGCYLGQENVQRVIHAHGALIDAPKMNKETKKVIYVCPTRHLIFLTKL